MNFKNVKKFNFLETFNYKKTELNFMILKSGDFRDDLVYILQLETLFHFKC